MLWKGFLHRTFSRCAYSVFIRCLVLNPFNSGYMDLKQKDAVLIAKTLAHLKVALFHLHRQLYIRHRKPNAKTFLKLYILHLQLLSRYIWMTHCRICETNHILKWRQQQHLRPRPLHIPPLSIIRRQGSLPKNRRWPMNSIIFTTHFRMKTI